MDPEPENPAPAPQTPPSEVAPAAPKSDEGGPNSDMGGPNAGEGGSTDAAKPPLKRRRNGHVARLPKTVRDQISQMILDGVPYPKIAENIGESGKGLSKDCVGEWARGGFNDWLQEMERAEDLGATREAALSLVEQKAGATVQDAGRTIASAQLYELLLSFDPRGFANAVR